MAPLDFASDGITGPSPQPYRATGFAKIPAALTHPEPNMNQGRSMHNDLEISQFGPPVPRGSPGSYAGVLEGPHRRHLVSVVTEAPNSMMIHAQHSEAAPSLSPAAATAGTRSRRFPDGGTNGAPKLALPLWNFNSDAFQKMSMAIWDPNTKTTLTKEEISLRQELGCSLNYNGEPENPRNLSANIPHSENCSLWLTGLPADVSYTELFVRLRGTGKIFATYINHASPENGHVTSAAKVTFFSFASAQALFNKFGRPESTRVARLRGRTVTVRMNRIKVSEYQTHGFGWEDEAGNEPSRVLIITGPRLLVDVASLMAYFSQRFFFELDQVVPLQEGDIRSYELRFASFYCQARSAYLALVKEPFFAQMGVTVRYGPDPCGE